MGDQGLRREAAVDLFVYGTLRSSGVRKRLVHADCDTIDATIAGWIVRRVKGELYPGIVRGDGVARGTIVFSVSHDDIARLDRFEGEEYVKTDAVAVGIADRRRYPVVVYRFKDEDALSDEQWDFDAFEKNGLAPFLKNERL